MHGNEEEMFREENISMSQKHTNQIVGQQILSQKLSQLSTKDAHSNEQRRDEDKSNICHNKRHLSTPSSQEMLSKKIRPWNEPVNEESENHRMTDYFDRLNDIFENMIKYHMIKNRTILSIHDLRELAIAKHRIAMIEIDKKLWTFYLKLGTGQCDILENYNTKVDRCIWPMVVKKLRTSTPKSIDTNKNISKEKSYEAIVYDHLEKLNEKIEFYTAEYYEKKNDLINFTDAMEETIQTFVQQYSIVPFEMKLNYKIKILSYNYADQLLEREYFRKNPTKNQIQLAQQLYNSRYAYVEAKQELIELKQRILCNKPTQLVYARAFSMISTLPTYSTTDARVYQQQIDQKEKELQDKMTSLMVESISEIENKILRCRTSVNKEIQQMSIYDKDMNTEFSTELLDLIDRRVDIINKKLEYASNFRIHYSLQHNYTDLSDTFAIPSHCFSPTMIMGTVLHLFTKEQLRLLNRGPTYIPPYQMYVSSTDLSMEEIIQKQYKSLQHDLNILFSKRKVHFVLSTMIKKEIKKQFTKTFSMTLPDSLRQRALYEKHLVQSIREHLKVHNLILRRTADQQNVFYLAERNEFEEKTDEFMIKTDIFQICHMIDEKNLQVTRDYLTNKMKSMNEQLQRIFSKEEYKKMHEKLHIIIDKVQLPYLYFLPDVSQNARELSVQPVVVARHSATTRLAYFLEKILRPTIERELDSTTFHNGTDFIRKLNDYIEQSGHGLRPTTNFVTITISNFYTMVDHDTMLLAFRDFLRDTCRLPTLQNISLNKVFLLTTLFLRNNLFYYDHKIYRFTKGSPTNFPITETLAIMYILPWLKALFRQPILEKEFYGRKISDQYRDIYLDIKIDSNIQFLQAYIENQNGTFYSRVYHDLTRLQQYTLPYAVGNSKETHSHWLRSSLIRAVRYCTSVDDFNQERIYLEVTCLANGYSLEFIEKHIDHFFTHFDAISLRSVLNQQVYKKLRLRLFNFVSEQYRIYRRNQDLEDHNQRFHLSYLYEYGPKQKFNQELEEILSKSLNPSKTSARTNPINIRFTTKLPYSLNALLSQQKPFHPLFYEKGIHYHLEKIVPTDTSPCVTSDQTPVSSDLSSLLSISTSESIQLYYSPSMSCSSLQVIPSLSPLLQEQQQQSNIIQQMPVRSSLTLVSLPNISRNLTVLLCEAKIWQDPDFELFWEMEPMMKSYAETAGGRTTFLHTSSQKSGNDSQYHSNMLQSSHMSNNTRRSSFTTTENENKMYDEQMRTTNVSVNLVDCMQCHVGIPRCELTEQLHNSNLQSEKEFVSQAQQLREEQNVATTTQFNQGISTAEKEENYGEGQDAEFFNPMNSFIIIDLPWPRATEGHKGK
ncbi:unnamed protein product [Rotaria sordida]|uniref:Helix-turn-helix domain-containing protein n=2 Tax=Rotaria sordida TaxID=392033 RepID=A0A814UBU7_9BILA|nr:unnamed protein product [Rotaria sordida]CAF3930178.1 unnamed protein product [Rotaria sordida]